MYLNALLDVIFEGCKRNFHCRNSTSLSSEIKYIEVISVNLINVIDNSKLTYNQLIL